MWLLALSIAYAVICYNPKSNDCHYEPLGDFTATHVANVETLQVFLMGNPTFIEQDVYILVNTSAPSECSFTPVILTRSAYNKYVIGLTPNSGVGLDMSWFTFYTMSSLILHNLTVDWIISSALEGDFTLTISNFTYLGCQETSTSALNRMVATIPEITTDVNIFAQFKSFDCGRITYFANRFDDEIVLSQSDYSAQWGLSSNEIFVRIITKDDLKNVTMDNGDVSLHFQDHSLSVNMATRSSSNSLIIEMSNCNVTNLTGNTSDFYSCALRCVNVSRCVLFDDWARSMYVDSEN